MPHFEKMLYDNALLARAYASQAARSTGDRRYRAVARATLDYLTARCAPEGGGFAWRRTPTPTAHEGLTFVWTPEQVRAALGDDELAERVCSCYGITAAGNFEGVERALLASTGRAAGRARGGAARCSTRATARPQPARDDKALAAWNGHGAGRLRRRRPAARPARLRRAARARSRAFLLGPLSEADGRLLRTWRDGTRRSPRSLEDYGAVADGLLGAPPRHRRAASGWTRRAG